MYSIQTPNFSLDIFDIMEGGKLDATPWAINIRVKNVDFSCKLKIEVTFFELMSFVRSLKNMFDTLSGEAELNEFFNNRSRIHFSCTHTGHIIINGELRTMSNFYMFDAEIDQTDIKEFVNGLSEDFLR